MTLNPYDTDKPTGNYFGINSVMGSTPSSDGYAIEPASDRADRAAVLSELWRLAESESVNTTRLVELVSASWHTDDVITAGGSRELTAQHARTVKLERDLDAAKNDLKVAVLAEELQTDRRDELLSTVESWQDLADRIQKLPGRGNATQLIKAVRSGAPVT